MIGYMKTVHVKKSKGVFKKITDILISDSYQ